jgi:hypothetical protein
MLNFWFDVPCFNLAAAFFILFNLSRVIPIPSLIFLSGFLAAVTEGSLLLPYILSMHESDRIFASVVIISEAAFFNLVVSISGLADVSSFVAEDFFITESDVKTFNDEL